MSPNTNKTNKKVLVVEDEAAIRDMIYMALSRAGFNTDTAETVQQAQLKIADQRPDLIILDWMLPTISGIQFTKQLKRHSLMKDIAIIMLTAKAEEDSKVQALEAGADDYIIKPFSPRELIARAHAILRRGPLLQPDGTLVAGELQLNTLLHQIHAASHQVDLSPLEYRLLAFFMTHPNRIYSRAELLTYVWKDASMVEERTVDALLKRLRKQLKHHQCEQYIQTAHGSGYYFSIPSLKV